jgi:hypothetical protein
MEGTSGKQLEAHSRPLNPYHRAKARFSRGLALRLEPAASFGTCGNFPIKNQENGEPRAPRERNSPLFAAVG